MFFESKAFNISKMVEFLIDTGSTNSAISPKEATIMKLDVSDLPDDKRDAIGFGGTFKNKLINRQVTLTFKSNADEHKIICGSFKVVYIPPEITRELREKLIRYTPSVLGMDILTKFKLYMDENQFELII